MLSNDLQMLQSFLASRTDRETGELFLTGDERASVALLLEAMITQTIQWERSACPAAAAAQREPTAYEEALTRQRSRRFTVIEGGRDA